MRPATPSPSAICSATPRSAPSTRPTSSCSPGRIPSAAAIKTALRRIALYSDPSDTLLVYFAGHTLTPAWSLGNDVYLVTPDLDEAALGDDPDAGLRLSYLHQDVLELFAGAATLILDCCRSGSLLGRHRDPIGLGGRYSALTACARDGAAREDPSLGHGVLTHHLLEGLRGGAADSTGRVTFEALSGYVLERGLDPQPTVDRPGLGHHRRR